MRWHRPCMGAVHRHLTARMVAVACAGGAYRRLQHIPTDGESIASVSTGLLVGWTSLAAVINLSAGTQLLGADASSRTSIALSTLGAVGAAAALCVVIRRSRRGYLAVAATSAWGLTTTALDSSRSAVARLGTAAGAVSILATAGSKALSQR